MDKNWCHNTAINSSSATESKREKKGEESWRIIATENARKTSHTLTDECVEPNAPKGITPRMKPWQHIFCPSGRGMMRETERDCPGWKTETDQLKWICTSAEWTSTLKTVCMLSGHTINTHTHTLCSYFGTLSKLGKTDFVRRLKVDIYGTQHCGSEVSKRRGVHKLPEGTKM